jgi:ubiquinone/menaquinone biosynthesis C-methylase UbiE
MASVAENIIYSYTYEFDETKRLTEDIGPIEFARTKELLQRLLPPILAVIVDVGGAAGPYSFWLSSLGYSVHLLDIVPVHIEKAKQIDADPKSSKLAGIHLGDARNLPFGDCFADAVIVHGPLYHLPEYSDRLQVLAEGKRILKRNRKLFAFGITRYAGLIYSITKGLVYDSDYRNMIATEIQTGRRLQSPKEKSCFKSAYFHLPTEMEKEVLEAGLTVERTYGILGPAWQVPDLQNDWNDPERRIVLLELARLTENEPILGPRFVTVSVNEKMKPNVLDKSLGA